MPAPSVHHKIKMEILYKYKFGFGKNFPTEQATLEVTEKLKEAIDKK